MSMYIIVDNDKNQIIKQIISMVKRELQVYRNKN